MALLLFVTSFNVVIRQETAKSLLAGSISCDQFIARFVKERGLAHKRRIKAEKLSELIRSGRLTIPAGPTPSYVPGDPNLRTSKDSRAKRPSPGYCSPHLRWRRMHQGLKSLWSIFTFTYRSFQSSICFLYLLNYVCPFLFLTFGEEHYHDSLYKSSNDITVSRFSLSYVYDSVAQVSV